MLFNVVKYSKINNSSFDDCHLSSGQHKANSWLTIDQHPLAVKGQINSHSRFSRGFIRSWQLVNFAGYFLSYCHAPTYSISIKYTILTVSLRSILIYFNSIKQLHVEYQEAFCWMFCSFLDVGYFYEFLVIWLTSATH